MRFSKPSVTALSLPPGKAELIVFDEALKGFGIRLRAGGKRTWIVQYRLGIRQRRLSLGNADVLDLAEAKSLARAALAKVGLAIDPQLEKERRREEASLALGAIIDEYLAVARRRLRPRSYEETRRHLKSAWATLHGAPINGIARSTLSARLSALSAERGAYAADHARTALSALYSWAMREGIAEGNPAALTNRPVVSVPRSRVLSDAELREIWAACRDDDHGRIVRLLLLTGQRREEVAGLAWSELDIENALWSLPPQRTKNGRPHQVPLSNAVLEIISSVRSREDRDRLFGDGEGGFSGWSRAKEGLDRRVLENRRRAALASGMDVEKGKPITPWRHHDLRRTFATRAADIGILPHIVEALLNHVSGAKAGVAGTYNRSLYSADKAVAVRRWAAHVESVVGERAAQVVSLQPMRRHG